MSGKELILYILLNDLEDEQIDKDGVLIGFCTMDEMAAQCGVGVETVKAWVSRGIVRSVTINGITLVSKEEFAVKKE